MKGQTCQTTMWVACSRSCHLFLPLCTHPPDFSPLLCQGPVGGGGGGGGGGAIYKVSTGCCEMLGYARANVEL